MLHERDAAEFGAVKKNLVEESRRVLEAAVGDARQASEAASRGRYSKVGVWGPPQPKRNVSARAILLRLVDATNQSRPMGA